MKDYNCLVIGAGVSGLVTAKELLDMGFEEITIFEKSKDLGGIWKTACWQNVTLTSSKWITEFGSFPMPDEYPDFPTPDQMMDYLQAFADHFDLKRRIHLGITVETIQRNPTHGYDITTNQGLCQNYDFVVICCGLHGKPIIPAIQGLENFKGEVIHGQSYKKPDLFRDKRVLCIGLGESAVGISSEISSVAAKTIVSGGSLVPIPRVYPYTNVPFDQITFGQIRKYMKDAQEVGMLGMSWHNRLPLALRPLFTSLHPAFHDFPQEWLPENWVPYRWGAKYWPNPNWQNPDTGNQNSGNLTQPENPTDDLLYLIMKKQIIPKSRVTHFEGNSAYFQDGSHVEVDIVVMNTGYQSSVLSMSLPDNWVYRHQELYKGCFHPGFSGLAFVGLVRPTVGSIPAMAEMQARWVAQVFSGQVELPDTFTLKQIIEKDAENHASTYPTIHKRLPHVYDFEVWMEEMAELIGCQPRFWESLNSWQKLQAYLLGSAEPLRFRMKGPGSVPGASSRYSKRVAKIYGMTRFGQIMRLHIILFLVYPHILSLTIGAILFWGFKLSTVFSIFISLCCWLLYMKADLFRFIAWSPIMFIDNFLLSRPIKQSKPLNHKDLPDYSHPEVFQIDS